MNKIIIDNTVFLTIKANFSNKYSHEDFLKIISMYGGDIKRVQNLLIKNDQLFIRNL